MKGVNVKMVDKRANDEVWKATLPDNWMDFNILVFQKGRFRKKKTTLYVDPSDVSAGVVVKGGIQLSS
tara:strand:- start:51 stop:254 length:204 start_codon:yes stop_codon:yes gene_type:complete